MKKILCALLVLGIIFASTFTAFAATAGDVNSDGKINSGDALGILKYAVGISPKDFNKNVADMNKDKKVNSSDALIVLQISVGLIKPDIEPTTPKDGAETLGYFNTAINKVKTDAKSFSKTRITDNEKMDGSVALQAMKSLVYTFMGIGAENAYTETVAKGNWGSVAFLYNSKLTASDVTSATCTQSGNNYIITLKLKNGSSSANKTNPTTPANSALDKCGICVETEDKACFDHKTASVIYDAIAGTYAGAEIKESYTNAIVKAEIDSKTGNLVNLLVEWNQQVAISNLMGMSATASGISHVTYKDSSIDSRSYSAT